MKMVAKLKKFEDNNSGPRIVGFTCNWNAYSGQEMAGVNRREYPVGVTLVRVACLGRMSVGLILKAFELGADGVIMLGCPSEECAYESGMTRAKELFAQTRRLLDLLGIDRRKLALVEIPLGRDDFWCLQITTFVKRVIRLNSNEPSTNNISIRNKAYGVRKDLTGCQRLSR